MQTSVIATTGQNNPSQAFTFNQIHQRERVREPQDRIPYRYAGTWVLLVPTAVKVSLTVEQNEEVDLTNVTESTASEWVDSSVTRELQPDGSFKWYAIDPRNNTRVEIDPDQAWFWTSEWQARERQAEEDLRLGRYEEFDNFDDFIASL